MHLSLTQQIKNAAQQGLLKSMDPDVVEEWIERAHELETSEQAILEVRMLLKSPECVWKAAKFSFKVEDIMRQLGWIGWRREALVNHVLQEMCENGEILMLEPETRHFYRCASDLKAA